jgi:broad specificity phosphatase PhoE
MSLLALVRHAQASFFADDYDQLSTLGRMQATLLGQHWVKQRLTWDEVYAGPRLRQRQTAELVSESYCQAGLPWPDPIVLPELDEYDLGGILGRLAHELARDDPGFNELAQSFQQCSENGERARRFQRKFEALLVHWLGAPAVPGLESWPAFRERVRGALGRITGKPGRGRRVAAFTSGGFIGTAVHLALAAPDRMALEVNWRIRNASVHQFVFTRDRLTLDSFNAVPHLAEEALWTYR